MTKQEFRAVAPSVRAAGRNRGGRPRASGRWLIHALLALSVATAVPARAGAEATNPHGGDPGAARLGEELFGRNCQQCHNTRGHGGKCPQLVRGAWAPGGANSDALMFDTISKGRPDTQMGAFGGSLSADEIWQIVTFLRAEALRVKAAEAKGGKSAEEDLWY